MSAVIEQLERKLDEMFILVAALPENEVKAKLTEYLCIKTSGLLERVVKQLVSDFIDGGSQQEVSRYVTTKMQNVSNLNNTKLEKLLESFSIDWQIEYKPSPQEIASLNSIIDLRNSIAHGGTQTASYSIIKGHYDNVKTVITLLKTIIRKKPRRAKARTSI